MSIHCPEHLKYTEEHEWYNPETGWTGITAFAQQELGDIVFVELPKREMSVKAGDPYMVVESVKSVSDVYAPVTGTVTDVNEVLEESPELVNDSPYEDGRMAKIEPGSDEEEDIPWMSAAEYQSYVQ